MDAVRGGEGVKGAWGLRDEISWRKAYRFIKYHANFNLGRWAGV